MMYHIRWSGYSAEFDTWEPGSHIYGTDAYTSAVREWTQEWQHHRTGIPSLVRRSTVHPGLFRVEWADSFGRVTVEPLHSIKGTVAWDLFVQQEKRRRYRLGHGKAR